MLSAVKITRTACYVYAHSTLLQLLFFLISLRDGYDLIMFLNICSVVHSTLNKLTLFQTIVFCLKPHIQNYYCSSYINE